MPIYESDEFDKMNDPSSQLRDKIEAEQKRRRISERERLQAEDFQRWMEEAWNL